MFFAACVQFEDQCSPDIGIPPDPRQWTQQHLDAADLRLTSIAPTPPRGDTDTDCVDVNVLGPGEHHTQHYGMRIEGLAANSNLARVGLEPVTFWLLVLYRYHIPFT